LSRGDSIKCNATSDAHELKDIPSYATCFERKVRNLEELIQELKAGRYKPVDLRTKQ